MFIDLDYEARFKSLQGGINILVSSYRNNPNAVIRNLISHLEVSSNMVIDIPAKNKLLKLLGELSMVKTDFYQIYHATEIGEYRQVAIDIDKLTTHIYHT